MLERYTSRVVHVQAVRLSPTNFEEVALLCGGTPVLDRNNDPVILLERPDNMKMVARIGSWLMQHENGNWVAIKHSNFMSRYEPSNPQANFRQTDLPEPEVVEYRVYPPYDR